LVPVDEFQGSFEHAEYFLAVFDVFSHGNPRARFEKKDGGVDHGSVFRGKKSAGYESNVGNFHILPFRLSDHSQVFLGAGPVQQIAGTDSQGVADADQGVYRRLTHAVFDLAQKAF